MRFIDEVDIVVQAGAGGNGCCSFRREAGVPRGGPNGGNGGRGGSVYLMATRDKNSLLDFKYKPRYRAGRGEHGMGKDMDGHSGEDLILELPVGTLVYDEKTSELIADLDSHGKRICVARGGKGGRGNLSFATSTNRAPRKKTPGELGEIRNFKLELRLLADVGLVGLPNAGKSSFLKSVSRATPKVADYPFTTLEPVLGVVDYKEQAFVMADLPGLIEGASEGQGLGHRFLKHVSRNKILLHLVDCTTASDDLIRDIEIIRQELGAFDEALLERPRILVFTKADLLSEPKRRQLEKWIKQTHPRSFLVSSHSGYGMNRLLDELITFISRPIEPMAESQPLHEEHVV